MLNKRTKIEASIGIVIILIISAYAGLATRTITDNSDTVYTQIVCSNGNTYEATFANLVTACATPNIEIKVPSCNITFTDTLYIASGVWLHGCGNSTVFYLGNAVNKTMIKNTDQVNGNSGIRLSDFKIDGNGLNQPIWWVVNAGRYSYAQAIYFRFVNDSSIDHINIVYSTSGGINFHQSTNITTSFCNIYYDGKGYDGTGYEHWWSKGIMYDNCSYGIIDTCIVYDSYSNGIVVESVDVTSSAFYTHDLLITNCISSYSDVGFYTENSKRIIFSNCIAFECHTDNVYGAHAGGYGFLTAASTYEILYDSCVSYHNGNLTGNGGCNYINSGSNNTYIGCISSNSSKDGFYSYGKNNNYVGCKSLYDNNFGFGGETYNVSFVGCTVDYAGNSGILITSSTPGNNIVSKIIDCLLTSCGLKTGASYGTGISCYSSNTTISGNTIHDSGVSINVVGAFCIVNNNHLSYGTIFNSAGIILASGAENTTVIGNNIANFNTGNGIGINARTKNNTIMGNRCYLCKYGILESAAADFNDISHNNCMGSITTNITIIGTSTWNSYNR